MTSWLASPVPDQVTLFASLFGAVTRDGAPVDGNAIAEHLSGAAPLDVFPVDGSGLTCFVVLAFHGRVGRTWKTDAVQAAQAAAHHGLGLYLERLPEATSRAEPSSGVHAWIFFETAIDVALARRFASALLYEASNGDPRVFKSFAHVYPLAGAPKTPDALLRLPLFGGARGESLFVAPARGLSVIADQWAVLASVARLSPAQAESFVGGHGLGPSATKTPATLRASISGSLVLQRPLPPALGRRLRQRLTVSNPEYVRRKREQMSLRNVRRLWVAWQRRGAAWLLPRGIESELIEWADQEGAVLERSDLRYEFERVSTLAVPPLDETQRALVDRLLAEDMTLLREPDDLSRTMVTLAAVARRGLPTLLLAPNRARVDHWREQAVLAGFDENDVGTLASRARLTVATYGELSGHAEKVDATFGHLVLDDCARISIELLTQAVRAVPATWILGLSDGSVRADGLDDQVELFVGRPLHHSRADDDNVLDVVVRSTRFHPQLLPRPQAHDVPESDVDDGGDDELFKLPRPAHARSASPAPSERSREWNALLDALSTDETRNEQVSSDVVSEARGGNRCLVLTARREHAQRLNDRIGEEVGVAMAIGSMPLARRREALRQFRDGEVAVLVVTEQLMGPGFDPSRVNRLFLALPLQSDGQLRQILSVVGRSGHADLVRIYDYVDVAVPKLNSMAQSRRRYYRKTKTTLNPDAMQLRLPFDDV